MSLRKQLVNIPMIDGLSDDDDSWGSDPPGMDDADNARWGVGKVMGARFGLELMADPSESVPPAICATHDSNQLIDLDGVAHVMSGDGMWRFNTVTQIWELINPGAPRPSRVVTDPLVRINLGLAKSDAAIADGVVCCVWEQVGTDGTNQGAFYGFWDISGDVPRPLAPIKKFSVVNNALRVTSIANRYFVATGLDGPSTSGSAQIFAFSYDLNSDDWTFVIGGFSDVIKADQYALITSADGTTNAWVAYSVAGAHAISKLDTSGGTLGYKALGTGDVQWMVENAYAHRLYVIAKNGNIDSCDTAMTTAFSSFNPFTYPASGHYTGRFYRASIGMADTTGSMWAARSTSGPYSYSAIAPVGTQLVKIVSGSPYSLNFFGGSVLAAHFSDYIPALGTSVVAVATQSAVTSGDSDSLGICYKAAPVAWLCRPEVVASKTELVVLSRYGQDAIDLGGNALGGGIAAFSTTSSHLPRIGTSAANRSLAICGYPVRVSDFFGGAGSMALGALSLYVKRAVDLARFELYNTIPTRNVQSQGLRMLGHGAGTSALDGAILAETTPQTPAYVMMDGWDSTAGTGLVFGFNYDAALPQKPYHLDNTGWNSTWTITHAEQLAATGPGSTMYVNKLLPLGNPNRQWGFVVVWQWYDAKGNLHRGTPSSVCYTVTWQLGRYNPIANPGEPLYVAEYTSVGNDGPPKLCFPQHYPTALLESVGSPPEVAIYGCPFDGNGDFRLLGVTTPKRDPVDEGRFYVVVQVTGTLCAWGVSLDNWDSLYPASPSLYTCAAGGLELASSPSPALLSICSTQSRLWGLNAEDRLDVWYTKPVASGIAPEWSDALRIRVPQDGGPAVGIAAIDDKVVVFKRTKVFVIEGDGGDAAGGNSSIRPPRLVSSDIGCDSLESIQEGPFGVLFHSVRGFYTLGRDLTYTFVGDKVMDQLTPASPDGLTRTILSGTIVPSESEVRYAANTARGADASTAVGLAWNYRLNRWTRRWDGNVLATVDGVEWSLYSYVGTTSVAAETPYSWGGRPDFGGLSMRSSWIKLNTLVGYGRVWRAVFLFRYFSDAIRITCAQDYQDGVDVKTWGLAELAGLADPSTGRLELYICPSVQKCSAIQFTISQVNPQESGKQIERGFELLGVSLEVGIRPSAFKRLPAAARK